VRLAVAATPEVAFPALDFLRGAQHSLIRVFTTPDKPVGRGRVMMPSPVATWAETNGIECIKVGKAIDMADSLADIDCVVTIAFGILLPQEILDIPSHGFINLHFSLLPSWRGAAPVQRAIENGDDHLGISVFALDAGMDTGPIYRQSSFPLDQKMRSKEALEFLGEKGVELLSHTLEDISKNILPTAQRTIGVSLARKLSKEESSIDWSMRAEAIERKIAAFYPNPIARTIFRGEVLKITRSTICNDFGSEYQLSPGEFFVEKERVLVGTSETPLELIEVIPQGKSEMRASDWARGARITIGERCG